MEMKDYLEVKSVIKILTMILETGISFIRLSYYVLWKLKTQNVIYKMSLLN